MKNLAAHLRGKALAATLALAAVSAPAAFAQSAALGNIAGVVRDSTGAIVANATITVTNTGTGAKRDLHHRL